MSRVVPFAAPLEDGQNAGEQRKSKLPLWVLILLALGVMLENRNQR
jgi:hypothetical protein